MSDDQKLGPEYGELTTDQINHLRTFRNRLQMGRLLLILAREQLHNAITPLTDLAGDDGIAISRSPIHQIVSDLHTHDWALTQKPDTLPASAQGQRADLIRTLGHIDRVLLDLQGPFAKDVLARGFDTEAWTKVPRIRTRDELVSLGLRLGVREDWHEPDEQEVTAVPVSSLFDGLQFDNAGTWPMESVARHYYGDDSEDQQRRIRESITEQHVILFQDSNPVGIVNLATLFAFATFLDREG